MTSATGKIIVEVCCGSLGDALAASDGGADRIELNSGLPLGGLTPSAGLVQSVLRSIRLPVIAMLRPRPGGFCYSVTDWETAHADAEWLLEAGVAGLAFGALDEHSRIDVRRVREIVRMAGEREAVFHRAFDLVSDWPSALDQLIDCGVTRVMTSGQAESALAGAATIHEMMERAAGRIEILPAGGIVPDHAAGLLAATGARQLHGSFSAPVSDPGYPPAGGFRFAPNDALRAVNLPTLQALMAALGR